MSDTAFPAGAVFTASYDADANLASETYPNGLVATTSRDATDTATQLAYTTPGATSPIMVFQNGPNEFGEVITAAGPDSNQTSIPTYGEIYSYDNAGRLTGVQDTSGSGANAVCTVRSYSYDANTNRASYTNNPGSNATCPTSGGVTSTNSVDAADRLTNPGYSYDAWGRTSNVPAADAGGAGNLAISYHANDMVAGMIQNGLQMSWQLDPAGRLYTFTDSAGAVHTEHFDGNGDSPLWTDSGSGNWTRNVTDISGSLSAIQDQAGTTSLQLADLHGDIVAQMSATTTAEGISAYFESTEFGVPRSLSGPQYAWLGASERSSDALGGLVLMGVRLYDPASGRFLQTDPITGGSANRYDYASQDPIDNRDLSGQSYWRYCGSCADAVPDWAWNFAYMGAIVWGPWYRAERWLFDNWYTTIKRYASYLDPGPSATPIAAYSQYGYSHNVLKAHWRGHWYEDSQWEYYYRAFGVVSFDLWFWHLFDLTVYIPGSFDNYTERDYVYVH
jgi:RHS repeat-associated protein